MCVQVTLTTKPAVVLLPVPPKPGRSRGREPAEKSSLADGSCDKNSSHVGISVVGRDLKHIENDAP